MLLTNVIVEGGRAGPGDDTKTSKPWGQPSRSQSWKALPSDEEVSLPQVEAGESLIHAVTLSRMQPAQLKEWP